MNLFSMETTMKLLEAIEYLGNENPEREKAEAALLDHFNAVLAQKINEEAVDQSEANAVIEIINVARQFGGDGEYEDGVFDISFRKKDQVFDFCDYLDATDAVYSYDVLVYEQADGATVESDVDIEDIEDDVGFEFVVIVYLNEEDVVYGLEMEDDYELNEVKRRIKVNAQGKKRIKMQCRKGFKWNGTTCVKIGGTELAKQRVAKRKMVISKRSQGAALKIRVARKSRKARRFRKAFGLSEDVTTSTANIAVPELPIDAKHLTEATDYSNNYWFNQPLAGDAGYLVGNSRSRDIIKIGKAPDGKYHAAVTIAGVAGTQSGDLNTVKSFIRTRIQKLGGGTTKLKLSYGNDDAFKLLECDFESGVKFEPSGANINTPTE